MVWFYLALKSKIKLQKIKYLSTDSEIMFVLNDRFTIISGCHHDHAHTRGTHLKSWIAVFG